MILVEIVEHCMLYAISTLIIRNRANVKYVLPFAR